MGNIQYNEYSCTHYQFEEIKLQNKMKLPHSTLYIYPSLDPTPFSPLYTINQKLTYILPIHHVYILLHTFIYMNII